MNTVFLNLRYVLMLLFVAFAMSFAGYADAQVTGGPVYGSALLEWVGPAKRVNGDPIAPGDIAGYEIRYKLVNDAEYTHIKIKGNVTQYEIADIKFGEYEFKIAAIDTDGVYAEFSESVYRQAGGKAKLETINLNVSVPQSSGMTCESTLKTTCVGFE